MTHMEAVGDAAAEDLQHPAVEGVELAADPGRDLVVHTVTLTSPPASERRSANTAPILKICTTRTTASHECNQQLVKAILTLKLAVSA
ncbi:hypothetical protein [Streptomyces sp. NPDC006510]|uniref:hypothetical protein n=1 Tax=Streptomyces sp. NPDC006510 TaxID=3155600 RepID=UPI0033AD77E9